MDKKIKKQIIKVIDGFASKKIGIIGDLILDKYISGHVKRISPEAPVPVLEVEKESFSFGGASNVANNIVALGAESYIVSVIGNDMPGNELMEMMNFKKNIKTDYILRTDQYKTIQKTRVIAEHQQIVRIDRERKFEYNDEIKRKIISNINKIYSFVNTVIISDYGKGILSKDIIDYSIKLANKKGIPIFIDPKTEHFFSYRKATSMTPNVAEAFGGMRMIESKEQKKVEEVGIKIVKKLGLKSLIITQSENGMTVFDNFNKKLKITHIPTKAKEVFDVTGAGDTVISVLSLAYSVSKNILLSAICSNYAASVIVAKLGTATVSKQELIQAIEE